ncbi:MAG: hypothetical protein HOV71_08430, partial [Hamadaea sp.]|nr:hypothetical protein [Hamadaea sp.]
MRVFRVLVGMVLLTVAAPALLAGAIAWYAMQHRDAAGEFRAGLEAVAHPGYAVVVPDVDALLRRDAPFARAGRTSMRITAFAGTPLFVGLASPSDVAALLQSSPYTSLDGISLGRGPLDVSSRVFSGTRTTPLGQLEEQPMWLRSGLGSVSYEPSEWRGRAVALVVTAPDGTSLGDVSLGAAVRFGWLDSTTWGLLILGPVLLLLGFVTLAWPARQVVYVLAPGDPGISLRSGEPVRWTDAPTRENAVVLPRPGSVYASAAVPAASPASASSGPSALGSSAPVGMPASSGAVGSSGSSGS